MVYTILTLYGAGLSSTEVYNIEAGLHTAWYGGL